MTSVVYWGYKNKDWLIDWLIDIIQLKTHTNIVEAVIEQKCLFGGYKS